MAGNRITSAGQVCQSECVRSFLQQSPRSCIMWRKCRNYLNAVEGGSRNQRETQFPQCPSDCVLERLWRYFENPYG
ncbi:hypothetical protein GCG54_00015336 [Colletotrichum gloeosporioides]|uniref:Uncharacterized protein n=1 Tax=Colletotrichum gloeosporioides TaxID=474922 RepID=A0A8H4C8C7_COLGL|nr:uncharacterized protein GCG54_00015336 [Colletotrichum gloeosporioides]KAF3799150.1 hypothetical protein GCG54_00015336 [Colletotrichum gloeosporioides]